MTTFEIGKTYETLSLCDHNCKVRVSVATRTAKFVTDIEGKRYGITIWDGIEQIRPWGRYSMAPIMGADDVVTA
jgi:hypothetical protein